MIGWWDGPEFITTAFALRDISLRGLGDHRGTAPPAAPIWLRLNDPAHPDWVEATVIDIAAQRRGPSLVRIKFQEACPYEFFKAAIRGIVPPGEAEGPGRPTPIAPTGRADIGHEGLPLVAKARVRSSRGGPPRGRAGVIVA